MPNASEIPPYLISKMTACIWHQPENTESLGEQNSEWLLLDVFFLEVSYPETKFSSVKDVAIVQSDSTPVWSLSVF